MTDIATCPLCRTPGEHWATVRDHHSGNPGSWSIDKCPRCAALYLDPMPDEAELGAFYPADYYSHQTHTPAHSLKARVRAAILPIGTIEPELPEPGRMLDIGCGSGWMLERYRANGWTVEGVEYSQSACDAGAARGLTIHHGSLLDANLPDAAYDYIRTNHSFEHLTNPHETLAEIIRLLRPGGVLFVGVPDSLGLTARLFKSEWFYVGAPIHTINYNRRNLQELLESHGFVVKSVRLNSNHGGTVGSLQSWLAAKFGRDVDLNRGPVTWAPLILLGFWSARLLDLLHLGDCVEITASRPRSS